MQHSSQQAPHFWYEIKLKIYYVCDLFFAVQTCAHRRLDFGAGLDRNPYGVCYISGRGLEDFIRYEPCSSEFPVCTGVHNTYNTQIYTNVHT